MNVILLEKMGNLGGIGDETLGREAGALVRTVAERLGLRASALAPEVGLVLLEGDANGDNAKGSSSVLGSLNYDTGINWGFSVRARLGLVVDERALLYVTGGPSWVNTNVDTNLGIGVADVANFKSGDESTEFGWVLGAGAGYAITEHLSMKAEYLHGWYGDANLDLFEVDNGVNTTKYVLKQNLQTNVVRVGLAYHFGGF